MPPIRDPGNWRLDNRAEVFAKPDVHREIIATRRDGQSHPETFRRRQHRANLAKLGPVSRTPSSLSRALPGGPIPKTHAAMSRPERRATVQRNHRREGRRPTRSIDSGGITAPAFAGATGLLRKGGVGQPAGRIGFIERKPQQDRLRKRRLGRARFGVRPERDCCQREGANQPAWYVHDFLLGLRAGC